MKEEHFDNTAEAVDEVPKGGSGRKNTIFTDDTLAKMILNTDQWFRVFHYVGPNYVKTIGTLNSSASYWRNKLRAQGYMMEYQTRQDKDEQYATLYAKVTPVQEDIL